MKNSKVKPLVTPKSTKNKASKKKKKKGKKTKKKKTVASSLDDEPKNIVESLVKSPVVANLFLKLMGQNVGGPLDDSKN